MGFKQTITVVFDLLKISNPNIKNEILRGISNEQWVKNLGTVSCSWYDTWPARF